MKVAENSSAPKSHVLYRTHVFPVAGASRRYTTLYVRCICIKCLYRGYSPTYDADQIQGRIQYIVKGGGSTMDGLEMSRRSRTGDAEGVAGGECERDLNLLSLGWGSGEPPTEKCQNLGAFPCNLGTLWPYFQPINTRFPPNSKKT